jgi:predicted acyltransferase
VCQHPILRYVLVVAITGISLIQIGFGIAFMSLGFKLPTFKSWVAFTWGIDLWLGAACMSDVTIAASMCILLHSSRTGAKQ